MKVNKGRSTHVITEREAGPQRIMVLIVFALLSIFTICSLYSIALVPTNPASWSMLVFFGLALALLVSYEKNMFPNIEHRKMPWALAMWFFAWMFVAFIVSFFMTMNISHLTMAVFFGLIFVLLSPYALTTDKGWKSITKRAKRAPKVAGGGARRAFNLKEKPKKPKKPKKIKRRKKKNTRIKTW